MKKVMYLPAVLVAVLLLTGCQPRLSQRGQNSPVQSRDEVVTDTTPEFIGTQQGTVPDQTGESDRSADTQTSTPAGQYIVYDPKAVVAAAQSGQAILFFHAPWCPTCKAADAELNKRLGEIPAGVTIFKTDYDSNSDLKKKYGVTYQHTFVQVDAQGNELTKWNGGGLEEVIARLK